MKKFILHGEMSELFCDSLEIDAHTMREVILSLSANYPEFKKYFISKSLKGIQYMFVDSKQQHLENYCLDLPLKDDVYHILPAVAGGAAMGTMFLANFAASFAMQKLSSKLGDGIEDDGSPEYEIITTNSFIYQNNENKIEQGTPVPVVYGQLRVGSKVIQSSIHNYDYDYDNATIYDIKTTETVLATLTDTEYTFVNPSEIIDLRESTDEAFGPYKTSTQDSTKRRLLEGGSSAFSANNGKLPSADSENESVAGFNNGGDGGKSTNEIKIFGPSDRSAMYAKASAGWWDHHAPSLPRPYLFAQQGHIDENMRPAGSRDLSVEILEKDGVQPSTTSTQSIAWTSKYQPMRVGARGNYQKLESIGIHKTLEILSEGPIVGFANPITGFNRDNGQPSYPYGASDLSIVSPNVSLAPLKYDPTLDTLVAQDGTNNVEILVSGTGYVNFTGQVTGNSTSTLPDFKITVANPISSTAASVGGISFDSPEGLTTFVAGTGNIENPDIGYISSSNNLFLLGVTGNAVSNSGELIANTNSATNFESPLNAQYLTQESTDNGNQYVFQLHQLEEDTDTLNQDFSIGAGYGKTGFDITISPNSSRFEFIVETEDSTPYDRVSQAEVLDLGRYESSISSSTFEDAINDEYFESTNTTIPLTNYGWDEMVRIYYDGGTEIDSLNLSGSTTWAPHSSYPYYTITVSSSNFLSPGNNATLTYNSAIGSENSSAIAWWNSLIGVSAGDYRRQSGGITRSIATWMQIGASLSNNPPFFDTFFGNNINSSTYNGIKYIKFGVGSGSTTATGTRNGNTPNLPAYTLEGGNDNFNSITVTNNGFNEKDDHASPCGFYNPLLFPRVTVFMLRKYQDGEGVVSYDFVPTNIDAVASVTARGTVQSIHLLRVPDNPVYDKNLGDAAGYTPISPHDINHFPFGSITTATFETVSFTTKFQDLGVACCIDPSNNASKLNLDINNGSLVLKNNPRDSFIEVSDWSDHISTNANSFSLSPSSVPYAAGIFQDFSLTGGNRLFYNNPGFTAFNKDFVLSSISDEFNTPSTFAEATLNIENINISNGYKVSSLPHLSSPTGTNFNVLCTGRLRTMTITGGSGYTFKNGTADGQTLTFDIFNRNKKISTIRTTNGGSGYRPNSEFYAYGIDTVVYLSSPNANTDYLNYIPNLSFRAKIKTSYEGTIVSTDIVDPGFNFNSNLLTFYDTWTTAHHTQINFLASLAHIPQADTFFLDPDDMFPKQDLILSIDDSHLEFNGNDGSVSKFYVRQNGLGFVYNQNISNVFSSIGTRYPVFDVEIDNNVVQSITINQTAPAQGYGLNDLDISLKASRPTIQTVVADTVDDDEYARFRSIYLNDVPIRDKNDRFNYSKFHFDMRVGQFTNGNGSTDMPDGTFSDDQDNRLMSSEFIIPSHTTVVDYPLFGPRNNGEKDYYYTYTIKNPEVSVVTLSIRIDKLHYIYEGDESAMYVNLIPIIAAGLGIMLGIMMAKAVAEALIPDPTSLISKGKGAVKGVATCGFTVTGDSTDAAAGSGFTVNVSEAAKQAALATFLSGLFAAVAGYILSEIAKYLVKCSKVPFLCFKVGEIIKNSGEIWPAKVLLAIEYGNEGETLKRDVVAFRGCATNPYVKDIVIDNLPDAAVAGTNNFRNRIIKVYRLTRELDPLRGGLKEARYNIEASLHSCTEHVAGFFNYPNTAVIGTRLNSKDHPQIPKREYLIKGRIIKVPNNYTPSTGEYTSESWDGTFAWQWTSNPAWIIYDLLTNKTYGMGKHGISEDQVDKWSFYTFARFCDEKIETVMDGVLDNTTPYKERRHMCNLYLDSEREAYEYIKDLLTIYNSTINFNGGKIYISTDNSVEKTGGPTMIFNNTNISEEGFSYSSTAATDRITACTVDYLDERDNYMLKTEYVEDATGISEYGYSHVKLAGNGITRRGEAHRLAWHKILTRQLEKEVITFKTGLRGAYLRISDVIEVLDNNKTSGHFGGKTLSRINSISQGLLDILLDVPVNSLMQSMNYPTNNTIWIETQFSPTDSTLYTWDATRAYTKFDIVYYNSEYYQLNVDFVLPGNSPPSDNSQSWRNIKYGAYVYLPFTMEGSSYDDFGFNLILEISPSVFIDDMSIAKGAAWMIKDYDSGKVAPKKYRIKEIKEIENMTFEIVAIEYLEEKYETIDKASASLAGYNSTEREYNEHEIVVPSS